MLHVHFFFCLIFQVQVDYKFLEDNVSASVLKFLITNFNISASDARLTTGSSLHGRSAAGVRDDALSRDSRLGSYDLGNADEHAG